MYILKNSSLMLMYEQYLELFERPNLFLSAQFTNWVYI